MKVAVTHVNCITGIINISSLNFINNQNTVVDLGGAREMRPLVQNFFIFMQFSVKIGQIVSWRPWCPLWEILDPPLE